VTAASKYAVSVVIPTYRRNDLLARCLRGVLSQDFDEPFEIVVVDDGRTPGTASAIRAVQDEKCADVPIRLFDGPSRGPASARNLGWRAAQADLIAFIDDDAFPADRKWLRMGISRLREPNIAGVSGKVTVPIPARPTDFQRNVHALEQGTFLTCNAFYKRSALEAVDGFDERFTVPFREDSDLQFRIEASGGQLVREPEAHVIHPAPEGRFAQSLRLQRYSLFNALLFKKHPDRYRREIQPEPPWSYYVINGLAAATLASFVRGRRSLGLLTAGAWLAMNFQFFLRRQRGASRTPRHIADMLLTSFAIPPASVYWRLRGALRFRAWFI
jgi:glycosyltransferase involved in cell wall biosynthesis